MLKAKPVPHRPKAAEQQSQNRELFSDSATGVCRCAPPPPPDSSQPPQPNPELNPKFGSWTSNSNQPPVAPPPPHTSQQPHLRALAAFGAQRVDPRLPPFEAERELAQAGVLAEAAAAAAGPQRPHGAHAGEAVACSGGVAWGGDVGGGGGEGETGR